MGLDEEDRFVGLRIYLGEDSLEPPAHALAGYGKLAVDPCSVVAAQDKTLVAVVDEFDVQVLFID